VVLGCTPDDSRTGGWLDSDGLPSIGAYLEKGDPLCRLVIRLWLCGWGSNDGDDSSDCWLHNTVWWLHYCLELKLLLSLNTFAFFLPNMMTPCYACQLTDLWCGVFWVFVCVLLTLNKILLMTILSTWS